ncbi:MAG: hypothetical protein WC013_00965 [Aeromonas bestiarum]
MTLPASGAISIAQVATELGIGAAGLSLNDSRVRNLFGKPSGIIRMSDGHGKSNMDRMTIGRYDNSGRSYLGYQGASPTGANFGAYSGTPTSYGSVVSLIIQRWSAYDNKILLQTNNLQVQPCSINFQLAGQSFTFAVKTNDSYGTAIPNTMSDLFLANVGGVCLVKIS